MAGALAAAVLEAGIWYVDPSYQEYSQGDGVIRLYPDMLGAVYNCEFDDDGYIVPTDADPQMHFPAYQTELQSVLITLAEPAKENIPVQVYYGATIFPYSPRHSVQASILRGTRQLAVTVPKLAYNLIRYRKL